jgi:hypothetical protein
MSEELAAMRELHVAKLPEYAEETAVVSERGTIHVKGCVYSVPSRLKYETVKVRVYEDKIEVEFAKKVELRCERLRGKQRHCINYRHVIWSLVRKPGGFARYVYREEMYPSVIFRQAYDAIQTPHRGVKGDLEYLRILHLAASTYEADVEAALELLLGDQRAVTSDAVKALVLAKPHAETPTLAPLKVDLSTYDSLLAEVGT